jgi:hypothetical protein
LFNGGSTTRSQETPSISRAKLTAHKTTGHTDPRWLRHHQLGTQGCCGTNMEWSSQVKPSVPKPHTLKFGRHHSRFRATGLKCICSAHASSVILASRVRKRHSYQIRYKRTPPPGPEQARNSYEAVAGMCSTPWEKVHCVEKHSPRSAIGA